MSARSLSTWQKWLDEDALQSGKRIITTAPDRVIDDVEYTLDAAQLVLSDTFPFVEVTGTSSATVRTYSMYTKDYADAGRPASVAEHDVWIRAWAFPFEEGEVWLDGGGGGGFLPITVDTNIPTWYKYGSTYQISTHGTQVDIALMASGSDDGWRVYVDGLMIVAIDES